MNKNRKVIRIRIGLTRKIEYAVFVLAILYVFILFTFPWKNFLFSFVNLLILAIMGASSHAFNRRGMFDLKEVFLIGTLLTLSICAMVLRGFSLNTTGLSVIVTTALLLMISKEEYQGPYRFLSVLFFLSVGSLLLQLSIFRDVQGRRVLSIIDPNFSGAIMFLFFLWSFQKKNILGITLGIASIFLFLSRAYFLAILIFALTQIFRKAVYRILDFFKVGNFFRLNMLLFLLVVVVSFVFVRETDLSSISGYHVDVSRLIQMRDASNHARFRTNIFSLNAIFGDQEIFLFGLGSRYHSFFVQGIGNTPHNAMLSLFAIYGVPFSLVYLLAVSRALNRVINSDNIAVVLSTAVYSMFLSSIMLSGWYLIVLFFLLSVDRTASRSKLFSKYWRFPRFTY